MSRRAEGWVFGTRIECVDAAQRSITRAVFPRTYINVPELVPHGHGNL